MSKTDKRAAIERLTKAREALANATPAEHEAANRKVVEAEKDVPLGRMRGWDYTDPNGA